MKQWLENKLVELNDLILSSYTKEFCYYYEGQREVVIELLKTIK
jgi:hypothetical protein